MRNFLAGCRFNFTSPVEPARNGPTSLAYSRSASHLVRSGTSAQSFQPCSRLAVVSLVTSTTGTLVTLPIITPDNHSRHRNRRQHAYDTESDLCRFFHHNSPPYQLSSQTILSQTHFFSVGSPPASVRSRSRS